MKSYCILGNCQANALASTLQMCEEFKSEYSYIRVTPIHRISQREHLDFINKIVPSTSLLMYRPISPTFRGGGFGFGDVVRKLSVVTRVISYPSIQFYGYNASARVSKLLPDAAKEASRQRLGLAGSELFHYSQILMAYLEGLYPDDALTRFHTGFDGDVDFVKDRTKQSLQQLKTSEDQFDITARLHEEIEEAYTQRQTFWSPRHPSGELFSIAARKVLDSVGIVPTNDDISRMPKRDPLRTPRYPMQEFVKTSLDLKFSSLDTFVSRNKTLSTSKMIDAYYDIYEKMKTPELISVMNDCFKNLKSWHQLRNQWPT